MADLSKIKLNGINYDIIAFTNLTEDHLDYHKTMKNYLKAKLLILDHLKQDAIIIANSDDENYIKFKKDKHKFLTIGYKGDYKIVDFNTNP